MACWECQLCHDVTFVAAWTWYIWVVLYIECCGILRGIKDWLKITLAMLCGDCYYSTKCPLRAIKDWVHFWGYNLNQLCDKWRSNWLLLLHVTPIYIVYCYIISGHTHKQLGCTKPLSQGISPLAIHTLYCIHSVCLVRLRITVSMAMVVNRTFTLGTMDLHTSYNIQWSLPCNFIFRVLNLHGWSRPWNYFNSKIFYVIR